MEFLLYTNKIALDYYFTGFEHRNRERLLKKKRGKRVQLFPVHGWLVCTTRKTKESCGGMLRRGKLRAFRSEYDSQVGPTKSK